MSARTSQSSGERPKKRRPATSSGLPVSVVIGRQLLDHLVVPIDPQQSKRHGSSDSGHGSHCGGSSGGKVESGVTSSISTKEPSVDITTAAASTKTAAASRANRRMPSVDQRWPFDDYYPPQYSHSFQVGSQVLCPPLSAGGKTRHAVGFVRGQQWARMVQWTATIVDIYRCGLGTPFWIAVSGHLADGTSVMTEFDARELARVQT
ncbi:unnamed protein product [Parajaminaea phylloscopi]